MLKPRGHRVLVLPDPVEEKSEGGIIMYASSNERNLERAGGQTGTVVAVGPTAWKAFDRLTLRQTDGRDEVFYIDPWANVGDKVLYSKYGGIFVKDTDGTEYVMLNDEDIVGVFEEE